MRGRGVQRRRVPPHPLAEGRRDAAAINEQLRGINNLKKKNRAGGRGMGARGARSGRGGSGAVHEPPPAPAPRSGGAAPAPNPASVPPNRGCVPPNPGSVPSPDPSCAPQNPGSVFPPVPPPPVLHPPCAPPEPLDASFQASAVEAPRTAVACGSSSPFPACHLLELLPRHCQCSVQRSPAACSGASCPQRRAPAPSSCLSLLLHIPAPFHPSLQ